jgi:hypothetical protein
VDEQLAMLILPDLAVGMEGYIQKVTDSVVFDHDIGRILFSHVSFDEIVHSERNFVIQNVTTGCFP